MKSLINFIANNGFKKETIQKFEKFFGLLTEYNEKFNLTAITDEQEVEFKHFIDSLASVKIINGKILDIGAGAGFPSVPLAVLREDCSFVLVDSLNKRVEFLNTVIKELDLKNVNAIHSRAEDLKNKIKNDFDFCVARAVAKINTLSEYCLPYLKINGIFIAYKAGGVEEELKEAENALKILGGKTLEIINKNFIIKNETFERNLILIKKIKETSAKYPRSGNKPKTEPL